jgi:hypothetical protein
MIREKKEEELKKYWKEIGKPVPLEDENVKGIGK